MLSEAKKKSNAKWNKKARENGIYKRFAADVNPSVIDNITDFCTIANISKAEFLRKLSAKIDDGSLYTFLNIDVEAANKPEPTNKKTV